MYTHVQMLCWIILQNILITWMCCPLIWWVENEIGFPHVFNIHKHRQLLCKLRQLLCKPRQNVLYDYMINVSKWILPMMWHTSVMCRASRPPLQKFFPKLAQFLAYRYMLFLFFKTCCDTWIKIPFGVPIILVTNHRNIHLTLFSIAQIWIMLLVSNSLLFSSMFTITGNLRCRP